MQKIPIDQLMNNSLELGLQNILSKDTNYRYLPWVGSEFNLQPKKIIVVAESVYLWGNNTEKIALQPDFGRIVLYDQALDFEGKFKHKPMFRNFMKAFIGLPIVDMNSKIEFWRNVVFHEFVQVPMSTKDNRPTKNDYIVGANYLSELVELLVPNTIVYFGTDWKKYISVRDAFLNTSWEVIDEKHLDKIGRSCPKVLMLKKSDSEIKILFIKHPSRGFSWNLWHSFLVENI